MNLSHAAMLVLVALTPVTRVQAQAPVRYEVRLTEADGRLLVGEELARGNNGMVRLSLSPGGSAFQIANGRVTLSANAQTDVLACPVWISGVPVIASNRLSIGGADVRTEGIVCNSTLTVLKPKALEALTAHPWDLAGRLAQASSNPALPGPRLQGAGCLTPDQLTLRDVRAAGNDLIVGVAVVPRGNGRSCP